MRRRETVRYKDYTIEVFSLGPHGYAATATRDGYTEISHGPPFRYHTTKLKEDFHGPGAKARAVEAAKKMVDDGPPPVLVWTLVDAGTRQPFAEVRAPSARSANTLARMEWGSTPGLDWVVLSHPASHPWDWNDNQIYRRLEP
jgi:hypothetical protein